MKKYWLWQWSALVIGVLLFASPAGAEPWAFGIMSDSQWKSNADGDNPNTVAVGIIKQLNRQFIAAGVKFVIQVGDLTDNGDAPNAMVTRAAAARELCQAGIAFFPLRGNHEGSQSAALKFQSFYPQTRGKGSCVYGASAFSSPFATLQGLSYGFDYHNARFLLLDQFTRTDGSNYHDTFNDNLLDQLDWIEARLAAKGDKKHGFVFSHKELLGANHQDTLFGASPSANPQAQNAFFRSLQHHGVRYEIGGHDHNHLRSIVRSPDGRSSLQNIITASDSYKFYTPQVPSNDEKFDLPAFGFRRETPIVQDLYTVGYYLVRMDGPRVRVEYYASANGCGGTLGKGQDCDLTVTPELSFSLRETFGYSLNGREFRIAQGQPYTSVEDRFAGTRAKILNGANKGSTRIYDNRPTIKDVNTGWTSKPKSPEMAAQCTAEQILVSNILTLWGMTELGTVKTDTFVLSLSYDKSPLHPENGGFGIAARNEEGCWDNAVDRNFGGEKRFLLGPWKAQYGLGTYGVDPATQTVWAVINFNGDFAVARPIEQVSGHTH